MTTRQKMNVPAEAARQINTQPISDARSIVDRLYGVSFDSEPGGKLDIGFIAEDLAEAIGEAVACDESGNDAKAIDYRRLVALLIEAVNEQQVQIKNQEHSLKEQRGQLAKLRGEIERIKISIRAAGVR